MGGRNLQNSGAGRVHRTGWGPRSGEGVEGVDLRWNSDGAYLYEISAVRKLSGLRDNMHI